MKIFYMTEKSSFPDSSRGPNKSQLQRCHDGLASAIRREDEATRCERIPGQIAGLKAPRSEYRKLQSYHHQRSETQAWLECE